MRSFTVAVWVIVLDQIAKLMWEPLGRNKDTAFNILDGRVAFILFALGIFMVFKADWFVLGLVLGGAWSNIIDRMRFGYVQDPFPAGRWAWNLADLAIAVGLLLWVVRDPKQPLEVHREREEGR